MRIVALINPTTHLVSGMRSALFASNAAFAAESALPLWSSFLAVFTFAGLGLILAARAFRRSIRKV
jgi:ABC-type polysaccharide/polyol phosphate export permease